MTYEHIGSIGVIRPEIVDLQSLALKEKRLGCSVGKRVDGVRTETRRSWGRLRELAGEACGVEVTFALSRFIPSVAHGRVAPTPKELHATVGPTGSAVPSTSTGFAGHGRRPFAVTKLTSAAWMRSNFNCVALVLVAAVSVRANRLTATIAATMTRITMAKSVSERPSCRFRDRMRQ
jgi:hypothetical protein